MHGVQSIICGDDSPKLASLRFFLLDNQFVGWWIFVTLKLILAQDCHEPLSDFITFSD